LLRELILHEKESGFLLFLPGYKSRENRLVCRCEEPFPLLYFREGRQNNLVVSPFSKGRLRGIKSLKKSPLIPLYKGGDLK
jgi:hypothetical protein